MTFGLALEPFPLAALTLAAGLVLAGLAWVGKQIVDGVLLAVDGDGNVLATDETIIAADAEGVAKSPAPSKADAKLGLIEWNGQIAATPLQARGALRMMKLEVIDLLVVGLPVSMFALKKAALEKLMVGNGRRSSAVCSVSSFLAKQKRTTFWSKPLP